MSYEITLVSRRPGEDWEEALDRAIERTEAEPELDESRRRQWAQIEREVRGLVGDVDSTLDETAGELAHPDSGLQVSLFSHEAAVSYRYGGQPDRERLHLLLADVVRIVERVTGLAPYDAQTGRQFEGETARGLGSS